MSRLSFRIFISTIFLAGCAVQPDYKRPAVELPDAWKQSAENLAKDGGWWRLYGDPVVEKLVEKPVVVVEKPVDPRVVVADKIKLNFTSVPEKVDVSEGDILLGVTPLSLQRAPAVVTELTFSAKGFKSVTRKVRFDSEQTIPIELEKDKKVTAPPLTKKPRQPGLAEDPYSQEEDLKESPF